MSDRRRRPLRRWRLRLRCAAHTYVYETLIHVQEHHPHAKRLLALQKITDQTCLDYDHSKLDVQPNETTGNEGYKYRVGELHPCHSAMCFFSGIRAGLCVQKTAEFWRLPGILTACVGPLQQIGKYPSQKPMVVPSLPPPHPVHGKVSESSYIGSDCGSCVVSWTSHS